MSVRAVPRIGDEVTVAYLAVRVGGVVAELHENLRALEVLTEEGDRLTFALNRATGRYMGDGRQSGARLLFSHG